MKGKYKQNQYNNESEYGPQQEEFEVQQLLIQEQEQLSAYERKTTHDIFLRMMSWLEKYIEVAGYYAND